MVAKHTIIEAAELIRSDPEPCKAQPALSSEPEERFLETGEPFFASMPLPYSVRYERQRPVAMLLTPWKVL